MDEQTKIDPSNNNSSTQQGWMESMNMGQQAPDAQMPEQQKSLDDIGEGMMPLYTF